MNVQCLGRLADGLAGFGQFAHLRGNLVALDAQTVVVRCGCQLWLASDATGGLLSLTAGTEELIKLLVQVVETTGLVGLALVHRSMHTFRQAIGLLFECDRHVHCYLVIEAEDLGLSGGQINDVVGIADRLHLKAHFLIWRRQTCMSGELSTGCVGANKQGVEDFPTLLHQWMHFGLAWQMPTSLAYWTQQISQNSKHTQLTS